MRTQLILSIQALVGVAGGVLMALSFGQAMPIQVAMLATGAILTLATVGWGCWKFSRLTSSIDAWDPRSATNLVTGMGDLDASLNGLKQNLSSHLGSDASAKDELDQVKEILDRVDRRKGAVDREGRPLSSAARLVGILKGYGNSLNTNIDQTTSCSRELRRTIEEIVDSSETQADLMSQTTSVVEEMSAHILSVCDDAEQALEASQAVRDNVNSGLEKFKQLMEEMKQIRKHTAARERKMQQLGQHTKEIESIVQTIGSLSSRTDLLALNASIESVRAGEHGRGFAVVAEEVRALSEQSAQAVLDITRRIEMIQLETSQSISGATGEDDQMQAVIQRVHETLESLESICESANSSANGLGGISTNSTRQLQLAQQIVEALEQSTDCTQKNRSRAEGAHWTAKSLGEAGEHLVRSLDLFRLTGAIDASPATPANP